MKTQNEMIEALIEDGADEEEIQELIENGELEQAYAQLMHEKEQQHEEEKEAELLQKIEEFFWEIQDEVQAQTGYKVRYDNSCWGSYYLMCNGRKLRISNHEPGHRWAEVDVFLWYKEPQDILKMKEVIINELLKFADEDSDEEQAA